MAVVASEQYAKSETGSIDSIGRRVLTRVFVVTGTEGEAESDKLRLVLAATGLPGEPSITGVPPVPVPQSSVAVGGVTLYYWGSRSWKREGVQDVWYLTYEYTTSDTSQYATVFAGSVNAGIEEVYRVHPEDALDWDNPSGVDIGGTPVDSGGQKTSVVKTDSKATVTAYRTDMPSISEFDDWVGYRNSNTYRGAPAGSVLYMGVDFSQDATSGLWRLTHQFAIDRFTYHAEQVATADSEGKIVTLPYNADGTSDLIRYVARRVYWVQPFGTTSFAGLP